MLFVVLIGPCRGSGAWRRRAVRRTSLRGRGCCSSAGTRTRWRWTSTRRWGSIRCSRGRSWSRAEGVYNWAPVDDALAAAHAAGRKVAPRVNTNESDFSQATPDWVFDAGAAAYALDGDVATRAAGADGRVFTRKFAPSWRRSASATTGIPRSSSCRRTRAWARTARWCGGSTSRRGRRDTAWTSTSRRWSWIDRWRQAFPDDAPGAHAELHRRMEIARR